MGDDSKLPISVELSASAKAEFKAEIKGEIPATSLGRLVDAVTDAIRPFTEARGLKADRILLERQEVLLEIARRTRERMEAEGQTPKPVSLRVLVPLLERASLTDSDDETLVNSWSLLLQSASVAPLPNHGIFVDVLSKLDGAHIRFLEFLVTGRGVPIDAFLERTPQDAQDFLRSALPRLLEEVVHTEASEEQAVEGLSQELLAYLAVPGCAQIAGGVTMRPGAKDETKYELEGAIDFAVFPEPIYNALEGLSIVTRHAVEYESYDNFAWFNYCRLTLFGLEFFEACHEPIQVNPK